MLPIFLRTYSSALCQILIRALEKPFVNPRNDSYKCPISDFFGHFRTKNSARSKNTQNGQETAWVGAECQIMLGKIVGSEKKVVVPKLQKVEVFGQ